MSVPSARFKSTTAEPPLAVSDVREKTLRECVSSAMERYFRHVGDHSATDLYQMVISEVEAPLLESVMMHAKGNQTRAAMLLGISRSTLRKKLALYGLD